MLQGIELEWAPSAPRVTRALVRLAAGDSATAGELLPSLPRNPETLAHRGLLHAALGERDPTGLLIYGRSGRMSVQVMRADRPRFGTVDPMAGSAREKQSAYDGYLAYWGT